MSDVNLTNDQNSPDDSSIRFANLELGDATPVVDDKAERVGQNDDKGQSGGIASMPAALVPTREVIPGVSIIQENVKRTLADDAAAKRGGFSLENPIYEWGRSVNEWGVANYKASRMDFDQMALLHDGCSALINVVNSEDRKDIMVDVPSLHMNDDGYLQVPGAGSFPLSKRAVEALSFHVTPTGAKYLSECPPWLRAKNYNHWFERGYRVDARATKRNNNDEVYVTDHVMLRTRKNQDSREVYSVCGPRYAVYDFNMIVERVYDFLAKKNVDARMDYTYNGYKSRLNILFHSDIQPENASVGEIFKAGLIVKTADDGSGAITVSCELFRNRCLNFLILSQDSVLVSRRTHKGQNETIESKLEEALGTVDEKIGYFTKAWSAGNVENVLERYNLANPREVFDNLCANKVVYVPGVDADAMSQRLFNAWEIEGGYSKTAFVNAITRAAHTESWASMDTVEEMEELGSKMLFQKVWNVSPPKDKTVADVLGGF